MTPVRRAIRALERRVAAIRPEVRAAETALAAGDARAALELTDSAIQQRPRDRSILGLRRRAYAMTGDLTAVAATTAALRRVRGGEVLADGERRLHGDMAETDPLWRPRIRGPRRPTAPRSDRVVLHLLKESLPYRESGFTMRSHENMRAQRKAGWDPVVVTALGFPRWTRSGAVAAVEEVDKIWHHRLDLGPGYPSDRSGRHLPRGLRLAGGGGGARGPAGDHPRVVGRARLRGGAGRAVARGPPAAAGRVRGALAVRRAGAGGDGHRRGTRPGHHRRSGGRRQLDPRALPPARRHGAARDARGRCRRDPVRVDARRHRGPRRPRRAGVDRAQRRRHQGLHASSAGPGAARALRPGRSIRHRLHQQPRPPARGPGDAHRGDRPPRRRRSRRRVPHRRGGSASRRARVDRRGVRRRRPDRVHRGRAPRRGRGAVRAARCVRRAAPGRAGRATRHAVEAVRGDGHGAAAHRRRPAGSDRGRARRGALAGLPGRGCAGAGGGRQAPDGRSGPREAPGRGRSGLGEPTSGHGRPTARAGRRSTRRSCATGAGGGAA